MSRADWLKAVRDLRTTILQGLVGLELLGTLYFSSRTLQLNRRGQPIERFTKSSSSEASRSLSSWRFGSREPIGVIVEELNRVLRGWCNYFRWGNSSRQFSWIDDYVHERLALFDSKKRQKHGRRWGRVHTKAWFARLGISTLPGMVRYVRTATATT